MRRSEILEWLRETDASRLETLWGRADETRRAHVGDEVHLRGLVEFSNHCRRSCAYCGLRAERRDVDRYRMTSDEILECAHRAVGHGYGTLVLQSGEDPGLDAEWFADVLRRVKCDTGLAITLSLGEREEAECLLWREAGADRYLLRFETSNRELYRRIHPDRGRKVSDRIETLRWLREIGYEIGGGVMVGIPGQTHDDLADDLETYRSLDLDMIGLGPYIPDPETPLGRDAAELAAPDGEQVPNTEEMTYKMLALSRLVCPDANIPSTTALATLNLDQGRELGLSRGANILMPNLTPLEYRSLYSIYPSKACLRESEGETHEGLKRRILAMGRRPGTGRGDSPRKLLAEAPAQGSE